jgi:hypothetical protein
MESDVNTKETVPRWSKYENKITIGMVNVQLARERNDPNTMVSWLGLWKPVSVSLILEGFQRSLVACDLHWRDVSGKKSRSSKGNNYTVQSRSTVLDSEPSRLTA